MATGKGAAASTSEGKSQPFKLPPGPLDPATWLEWSRQWQGPEGNGTAIPSGFPGFPGFEAFTASPLAGVKIDSAQLAEIQQRYMRDFAELWRGLAQGDIESAGNLHDRRFASDAWHKNAPYRYTAAFYLLNARVLTEMAEAVEADPRPASASASRCRNGSTRCHRPISSPPTPTRRIA